MALSTHSTGGNDKVPPMAPTPGVTPEQSAAALPTEPRLLDDLEPMYLARLYPEALSKGATAAKDAAMAAGKAAFEAGKTLHASQQDPVGDTPPEDPAKPPPPPPPPPKPDTAAHS
jgi:hypothetical protein